ncbi:MAG: putative DsbA family dithiol-disulfide isomerase [Sulfurimonas sp.]|jgi:predicted DsbA family dithiol-disulfide isomerase
MHSLVRGKVKIDIVSDVVCPWCAIGYQRLNQAIKELKIEDRVEVVWHPFELNPDMPREGQNANKYLMNKLRLSEDGLIQKRKSVAKIGEESGFKFNYFQKMKKVNTFNAHVLLDYAKELNKQTELKVRLQKAYFAEKKDINNRDVLFLEVKSVGLNAYEAMARLDNDEAIKRVQDEEQYWRDRGVSAIPTMIFNDSVVRRGANQVEMYKELLTELINKK